MDKSDPTYIQDLPSDTFYPGTDHKILKIAVIGAGIAGLSAAAGLAHAGHDVEIFERSRLAKEVGAAINVPPNATRVLTHWGFDYDRSKGAVVEQGRVVTSDSMHQIYSGTYESFGPKYGALWYFFHRVDLHNELKRLALESNGKYEPAKIHLSSEVADVDCETGTLKLSDGSSQQFDLVIAADGVHSVITNKVTGEETPATPTGMSAFRFLIPTEKLVKSEKIHDMFEDQPITMNVCTTKDRRLVWYPCRSGEVQNFVGIHPDRTGGTEKEAWNVSAPMEDLVDTFKEFHPSIIEICKNAEDLNLWKLLYRPPIGNWYKGKVVLIGDAAHPMLPHQGQGGGQAIEDGGALCALFSNLTSVDQIPDRLRLFQEIRKNRAAAMQIFSNAGQEEAEKIEKEAQQYVDGPVPKNPGEFHEYNFKYNVLRESMNALQALEAIKQIHVVKS